MSNIFELANAIELAGERDTFAAHALTGIMAKCASTTMPQATRKALAVLAYQMADEMVEARNARNKTDEVANNAV